MIINSMWFLAPKLKSLFKTVLMKSNHFSGPLISQLMKTFTSLLISCLLIAGFSVTAGQQPAGMSKINIVSAPGMTGLAEKWASECMVIQKDISINVIRTESIDKEALAANKAEFGLVTGDGLSTGEGLWKMTIGREVIVPIINSENPFIEQLRKDGVSPDEFAGLMVPGRQVWSTVTGSGMEKPVHIYAAGQPSDLAMLKRFLAADLSTGQGVMLVGSEDEVIQAVSKDPYAIGFCKMAALQAVAGQGANLPFTLLPIDKNGNGTIDYMEQIFDNTESLTRGVWIGKYPAALTNSIYLVSAVQPGDGAEAAFARYLLDDGQKAFAGSGFTGLADAERLSRLAKFDRNIINVTPPPKPFLSPVILIIFASAALILLIAFTLVYFSRDRKSQHVPYHTAVAGLSPDSLVYPKGLLFSKSHTWSFMEKEGLVKVGIDDFLQHITGQVTRVDMKKPGERIRKGEVILSLIQKGKKLNIYSPVSGVIAERNTLLVNTPGHINTSPFSSGWVYRIEPANWLKDIQLMEMAENYKTWLSGEFSRLKDFLASSIKVSRMEFEHVVLQDGGILTDHLLEDFGPEVWEDFQTHFMDKYR